jgi:glycine cleavage system regulatory protein
LYGLKPVPFNGLSPGLLRKVSMLHTFVAYVEDKPGVLTRVASLFRRLNINISSVTVGA